jgi:SAM-dependent methyltransferase
MAAPDRPRASGTDRYAETADALVKQYESLAFADLHREILHLIPIAPSWVLDVGAGTGRDAAAFAALGHSVVAVEPTLELRTHGQRLHRLAGITWIDDALPDLSKVHECAEHFDVVMLTAVWMHLDADQRRRAMPRVSRLLRPGGLMALSLRHGPAPAGRRMFDVSATETSALAREVGLEMIHHNEREALLGQSGVWWSVLAFRRA